MKKALAAGVPLMLAAMGANAQSSVTLYGLIDLGVDYVNNVANASGGKLQPGTGGKLVQMQSGVPAGSRWGLKGSEDLGGGLKTIFRLESGFNAGTGAQGGGLAFSRNAYVGLQSDTYGTVTFGKQWDANVDLIEPFSLNYYVGGWYFSHPVDNDNLDNGFAINNAIKYVSPSIAGLTFEGHYSPGGTAGQFSTNESFSTAAQYNLGPFSAGIGYLHVTTPISAVAGYGSGGGYVNTVYGNALAAARSQGVLAAGASYDFGQFKLLGDFSEVTFAAGDSGQNVKFENYEISGLYSLTPTVKLGAGYTFTAGHDDATGAQAKYHQFNLVAQYSLSKSTTVYAMGSYQRAAGDATNAQNAGFNPSNSRSQAVERVGITHAF